MPNMTVPQAIELALQYHRSGRLVEAEDVYRQVLKQQPRCADALHYLGLLSHQLGRRAMGIDLLRQAIEVNPSAARYHHNLGTIWLEEGNEQQAIPSLRTATQLRPDYTDAHFNLGKALEQTGQWDEAVASYREALRLQPTDAAALNNLAAVLKNQGCLDEAIACMRKAIELRPQDAVAHSNLVFLLHFQPGLDAQDLYDEHVRWAQQHAAILADQIQPHKNDPAPDRRLRVGYVSAGFQRHVAACFLLPMLEAHNHERFEVFCYSGSKKSDDVTDRFRRHADAWRDTAALSDIQLAELIRQDQIDILVDLTLHMAGSRLLVFARKPAPVQVTYLGYPSTTGLATMDYRLTDPHLDPDDANAPFYTEKSIRLPQTWWCYRPIDDPPDLSPLPALHAGRVTFGSLNSFFKINVEVLSQWSRILQAVPGSRLLLLANEGSHRERVRGIFQQRQISGERMQFVGRQEWAQYMASYHEIDIGLDPFPANGHTTTCDALWMGVPVVTLPGRTAISRGALSLLSNVGLQELAAATPDDYVRIAVELAGDLERLAQLRAQLRTRMRQSPIMDAPRFVGQLEETYRQMWRAWCAEVVFARRGA